MSDKIIEGDLLRFSESNKIKTGEVYKLKLKKLKNNVNIKGSNSLQLLLYSLITCDAISHKKS